MADYCPDCLHLKICHDDDGFCDICEDDLDDMPGGAQGAHVSACPSQDLHASRKPAQPKAKMEET